MKRKNSTRMLLAGLFSAGLFYVIVNLIGGRWAELPLYIAAGIEILLIYFSLKRPPVKRRGLFFTAVGILIYILISTLMGAFSEIVLMASGGILVYAAVLSNPEFPLTKRAISTGIVVAIVMTFLGIYLALKIGVVYFIGAEMLGAIILTMKGTYTPEENTVVVSIANGSSMIAIGVLIIFPAIAIFEPIVAQELITYPFIAFVTGVSAVFGLLLVAPFRNRFEDDPWPQVHPQAECIISLGLDKTAKKTVGIGLAASGAWVGGTRVTETLTSASLSSLPHALEPIIPAAGFIPDWIGMSNSPLIAGIGYFVGWKRTLTLMFGSAISLAIWLFLEGGQLIHFSDHLRRPEILYLALGVFAAVIVSDVLSSRESDEFSNDDFEEAIRKQNAPEMEHGIVIETPHKPSDVLRFLRVKEELFSIEALKEEIREMVKSPVEYMKSRRGQLPLWVSFASIILFMITGIIVFAVLRPFVGLEIHWLLFIIGSPLALVSAYFTARSIGETGMLAGYLSDIIAIPAILFFTISFQSITTFMSILGALQDASIALLVHLKLGKMTGVRGQVIVKAVSVGFIIGTFVGSLITYMIYITYGFGGTEFPAPAAQLFGFVIHSLRSIREFRPPGVDQLSGIIPIFAFGYLLIFGMAGFILGRQISKRGLSAMSLVVGLLIPPATSVTMLLGGLVDYHHKERGQIISADDLEEHAKDKSRKERTNRILSGVVAGEAVVTVIWVSLSAVSLLL